MINSLAHEVVGYEWKRIRNGDFLPAGVVNGGQTGKEGRMYVARQRAGECGKLGLSNLRVSNIWGHGASCTEEGDVLTVKPGYRIEWRSIQTDEPLPDGAVSAGCTEESHEVCVARNKKGDCGKLDLMENGNAWSIVCPKSAPVWEGEVLVVLPDPNGIGPERPFLTATASAGYPNAGPSSSPGAVSNSWEANMSETFMAVNRLRLQNAPNARQQYDAWLARARGVRGSPVHDAAAMNDTTALVTLLSGDGQEPVDVDARGSHGETALHHAAYTGAVDCIAILLAAGWDPSAKTSGGSSPLDYIGLDSSRLEPQDDSVDPSLVHVQRSVACLLLFLYGALPDDRKSRNKIDNLTQLGDSWERVVGTVQPADCRESREVAFLRNWQEFSRAMSAAECFGPSCVLLRLVLEARVPVHVRVRHSKLLNAPRAVTAARGIYQYMGLHDGYPSFKQQEGRFHATWSSGKWHLQDGVEAEEVGLQRFQTAEEVSLSSDNGDLPLLGSSWQDLIVEGAAHDTVIDTFRTYSSSGFLPAIAPWDPASDDVPFIGLLNPRSGNKMGALVLEEASRFPAYRHRFFDIIQVATNALVFQSFRQQLEDVVTEARQKNKECRPRLICGGGDGTASFALFCVFKALHDDETGELRWPDEELQRLFPALVQMPLGTGNDLAGVLGWGRTINPLSNPKGALAWFRSAVSYRHPVKPFDVWGLSPSQPGMKVCALAGLNSNHPDRPRFKECGPSVPFICLLYFSVGFDAFVVAQTELNRRDVRWQNFLEYGNQISASILGVQRRNIDLSGLRVTVPIEDDVTPRRDSDVQPSPLFASLSKSRNSRDFDGPSGSIGNIQVDKGQFFPPPDRPTSTGDYVSVGFLNINSFGGGTWAALERADFEDGRLDLFRQRDYFGNVLKRGQYFSTAKHTEAEFSVPETLPGVHCQCDGEARFIFHPGHTSFGVHVRRVMQIPVVVGPELNEALIGRSSGWLEVIDHDAGKGDAAFIPATCIDECKALCIRHDFGGFCVVGGRAHFRAETGEALKTKLFARKGATFYIRDQEVQDVLFGFTGSEEEVHMFKFQLRDWISGTKAEELCANHTEIQHLERRASSYAQGSCARSQRIYHDFGPTIAQNICTRCAVNVWNRGCKGCGRHYCAKCIIQHVGSAPAVQWAFGDVLISSWSSTLCLDDATQEITALEGSRPIRIYVACAGKEPVKKDLGSPGEACAWLREYKQEDLDAEYHDAEEDIFEDPEDVQEATANSRLPQDDDEEPEEEYLQLLQRSQS